MLPKKKNSCHRTTKQINTTCSINLHLLVTHTASPCPLLEISFRTYLPMKPCFSSGPALWDSPQISQSGSPIPFLISRKTSLVSLLRTYYVYICHPLSFLRVTAVLCQFLGPRQCIADIALEIDSRGMLYKDPKSMFTCMWLAQCTSMEKRKKKPFEIGFQSCSAMP